MCEGWRNVLNWTFKVVRAVAAGIERFRTSKQGCIRICAYPLCSEADEYFGGLSTFSEDGNDIADYEYTLAIAPGGSREAEFMEDDGKISVDTYGVTAMKIADCSRAQDLGLVPLSGLSYPERQMEDPECGYGKWLGALCVEVSKRDVNGKWSNYCGIYVSVSGADEKADLICARAGADMIARAFQMRGDDFRCVIPAEP